MARRRARAVRRRAVSLSLAAVLALGLVPFGASPAPAETTQTPIMGPPVLTASELVAFYETKGVEAKLEEGTSIEDLAAYYIEEGLAAGVRGDIAFAQALHETGSFQYGGDVEPEQNNFAGIGATGGVPGNAFETAQEGVRAQIHHLKAYADPTMVEYQDYPDVDPGWLDPGPVIPIDEEKPRFTGLPEWWFGSVTTVEELTGTWAADTEYHHKLLKVWKDMLLHAGKHDALHPLTGDWNGDGRDTPGWYINGSVTLAANVSGSSVLEQYTYGRAGDIPIVGDWDGDGKDTLGVVREGRWYLRNKHRGGSADLDFKYGRVLEGDYPLAGDWNGNGTDTVGIVREGEWHLRNKNSGGPGQIVYKYGRVRQGDLPLMGDWSGDGQDTPAIVRGREWHLRYVHKAGAADKVFKYGASGDVAVVGDWNGDRVDTPGVVRGSNWLLRNRLNGGDAQVQTHFYAR